MVKASPFLVWSFAALAVLVAGAIPAGLYWAERRRGLPATASRRRAAVAGAAVALWLTATAGVAAAGGLRFTGRPPSMVVLLAVTAALAVWLARSRVGARLALDLPLAALVGVQGFRLPLELLLHRAYAEGVMPVQMSFEGLNFDIVTGVSAIAVAVLLAAGRMPRWGVLAWNWMGAALLATIFVIANLSAPTPFRAFPNEPANVWILQAPFVWLPTVLVFTALVGHLLVLRRLRVPS
jgi:hypothetical protein